MKTKKTYWLNGVLKRESSYKNNKLHGIENEWYADGQPWSKEEYRDGRRHGLARCWDMDGTPKFKIYYLYGNRVSREEYYKHILTEKLAGLE